MEPERSSTLEHPGGGGRSGVTALVGAAALVLFVPAGIYLVLHAVGLGGVAWLAGGVGWAVILGLVASRGWFRSSQVD